MIKIAPALVILMSLCIYGFSQKPDIEKIKTTYRHLPAKPVPDSIKTYSIQVINLSKAPVMLNDVMMQKYLQLEGFQYNPLKPDMIITVVIDDVILESGTGSKGMVGGAPAQFVYTVSAGMVGRVGFSTPDNKYEYYSVTALEKAGDLITVMESPTTYADDDAAKQALANDKTIKEKVMSAFADNVFKNIGAYLNKQHGYSVKTEYLPVWGIKAKGTDYQDFDQALALYQAGIALVDQPDKKDVMNSKLKEAIAIWEKAVAEYNPSDKNARISTKNILEVYANLAIASTWVNNFAEAKKYYALAEKEKGLVLWKPVIQELILSREQGTLQDELRKSNRLTIVKKPSALYRSPEFVSGNSKFRIKYIESYEDLNPKDLRSRKVFEYDEKGLLVKVYEQVYRYATKTFHGAGGVQTIAYNQHEATITLPDATKKNKPGEVFTIRQGKVVKYNGTQETMNDYFERHYDYSYYPDGSLKKVTRAQDESGVATYDFTRENGKMKNIEVKMWSLDMKDTVYTNYRYTFEGQGGKTTVTSYTNTGGKNNMARKAATYTYTTDANGLILSIASEGQLIIYKYDANNNLIESIRRSDTTPIHHTYVWEEGPGNAFFYFFRPKDYRTYPGLYPNLF